MSNWLEQQFTSSGDADQSVEFDKLFDRKKFTVQKNNISEQVFKWMLKKKTVLDECDRMYINLPKIKNAIQIKTGLIFNRGVYIKDKDFDESQTELSSFYDSFPCETVEFLSDVQKLIDTKANCLVCYDEEAKMFTILEPHQYWLVTKAVSIINAKHSIIGIAYKDKDKKDVFIDTLNAKNIIIIRGTPSSVLGIPPLIFNERTSKTILALIQREYLIANSGGFGKSVISPSGDSRADTDELNQLENDFNLQMQDPTKYALFTNSSYDVKTVQPLQSNNNFWEQHEVAFALHAATLTGVKPSFLLPSREINRATKEQEYKEMIQETIQPANNKMTKLVNSMYRIWQSFNPNTPDLELTIENPKASLDVDCSLTDLISMADKNLIDINELRKMIGLEEYDKEKLQEIKDYRLQLLAGSKKTGSSHF